MTAQLRLGRLNLPLKERPRKLGIKQRDKRLLRVRCQRGDDHAGMGMRHVAGSLPGRVDDIWTRALKRIEHDRQPLCPIVKGAPFNSGKDRAAGH